MKRSQLACLIILAATLALSYGLLRAAEVKVVLRQRVLNVDPLLGAAVTTCLVAVMCAGWQVFREQKKRASIRNLFGVHVSPKLVEQMVASGEEPKLGGHEVEMTAYFSDLQGYAAFTERLSAAQLIEVMNEYLTACTDVIQEEGGTLDKYVGDAIVAMFGAPIHLPDHAYRACVAAQRAQLKLDELRTKWRRESQKWPAMLATTRMQIGLNSGPCIVGNMGSRTRFNYTMMGDNVNLAARMESGARSWGAYTMCTEATQAACLQYGGDRVVFRPLGTIVIVGRASPISIYEIAGLKETIAARTRECLGVFADGLAKYQARDWDGAIQRFQQSAQLEPHTPGKLTGVRSNPSVVYLGLCQNYKTQPPPDDWNGGFVVRRG